MEILGVTSILTMNHIAWDLDKVFQGEEGRVSDNQVYELIGAQKQITKKFNAALGLVVSIYCTYSVPYFGFNCGRGG